MIGWCYVYQSAALIFVKCCSAWSVAFRSFHSQSNVGIWLEKVQESRTEFHHQKLLQIFKYCVYL